MELLGTELLTAILDRLPLAQVAGSFAQTCKSHETIAMQIIEHCKWSVTSTITRSRNDTSTYGPATGANVKVSTRVIGIFQDRKQAIGAAAAERNAFVRTVMEVHASDAVRLTTHRTANGQWYTGSIDHPGGVYGAP